MPIHLAQLSITLAALAFLLLYLKVAMAINQKLNCHSARDLREVRLISDFRLNWRLAIALLISSILIFQELLLKSPISAAVGIFDEIVVALTFLFLVWKVVVTGRLHKFEVLVIVGGFYLVFVSLFGLQSNILNIIMQAAIHMKFFLLFVLINRTIRDRNDAFYVTKVMFLVSMLGFLLNAVMQESFFALFDMESVRRYGMLRIKGFQLKPNDLGIFVSLIFVQAVFKYCVARHYSRLLTFGMLAIVVIVMTGSRIALVIVLFVGLTMLRHTRGLSRLLPVFLGVFLIPLLFLSDLFVEAMISTYTDVASLGEIEDSLYIRGIMIYNGIRLLIMYFPIGTGAATFGSVLSVGSPVYELVGMADLPFVEEFWGLYDSNLATIMGEFGAIGILMYGLILSAIYRYSCGRHRFQRDYILHRKYYRIIIACLVFVSLTNPVFMSQFNGIIFALALTAGGFGKWTMPSTNNRNRCVSEKTRAQG